MPADEVALRTTEVQEHVESGTGPGVGLFRERGREVTRAEAFFDAAFAFAVTLLVVSLEVPRDYAELMDALRGVPALAACFIVLFQIWYAHYRFCRRYGLSDVGTLVLDGLLVFIVLVYVYPLKYLALAAMEALTGFGPLQGRPLAARLPFERIDELFMLYGVGFAAVWTILAVLVGRALARRERLGLNAVELCDTLHSICRYAGMAGIGVLSCMLAWVLPGRSVVLAGWAYALIAVEEFCLGWYFGYRRDYAVQHLIAAGRLAANEENGA